MKLVSRVVIELLPVSKVEQANLTKIGYKDPRKPMWLAGLFMVENWSDRQLRFVQIAVLVRTTITDTVEISAYSTLAKPMDLVLDF